jgi:opacity protein-like surface antigen
MKAFSFSFGTLALGAFLQTITAQAQYRSFTTGDAGWYWRLDAGAAIPQDGQVTDFAGFNSGQKVSYDTGFAFNGGIGYFFNKYVGTEFELGSTWNYLKSVEGASIHDTSFGTAPILANIILQYQIPQTIVVPYIGGGVGGALTFFDAHDYYQPVPGGAIVLHGSESDFVFAWQAQAGVRFNLNDTMSVGLAYRYLHTDQSEFSFESHHHNSSDFEIGFSAFESHVVTASFSMKF